MPGVTGLLGPNGAGKIDAAATGDRPAAAEPGQRPRPGPGGLEQRGAQSPHRPVPGAGRLLRVDDRLGLRPHLRRLSGLARGEARTAAEPRDRCRRHDAEQGPRDSRLLEGHAAAHQTGPGPGPRSGRAVPRRAAHRHRPGGPARLDGHHPAARRARAKACWFPATCCTKCNR